MPYVDMSEPLVPAPSCRNGCHILREASALSVPLQPGDTRASASGTGSKYGSHAFRFITTAVILRENQEATHRYNHGTVSDIHPDSLHSNARRKLKPDDLLVKIRGGSVWGCEKFCLTSHGNRLTDTRKGLKTIIQVNSSAGQCPDWLSCRNCRGTGRPEPKKRFSTP